MRRYDVDAFFTNGWPPISGDPVDRSMVCHCPHCRERWESASDRPLPEARVRLIDGLRRNAEETA